MSTKPTRLVITGARETVPRELAATGKACGGTFSVVLRPRRGEARVVLVVKKDVHAGVFSSPDHPAMPQMAMTSTEARALLRAGKDDGDAALPVLQGSWAGTITCSAEGGAEVALHRKAGPVTLHVRSAPHGKGWLASVDRAETWYGPSGTTKPVGHPTLADACRAAAELATASASEVCGKRTVERRGASDAAYAAKHPLKPENVRRSPIDTMDAALAKLVVVAPVKKPTKPGKPTKITSAEQALELAGRVPQLEAELSSSATLPAGLRRSEQLIRYAVEIIRTNCSGATGAAAAAKVEEAVRLHNAALQGGLEAATALRPAIRALAAEAARAAKTSCVYNDAFFAKPAKPGQRDADKVGDGRPAPANPRAPRAPAAPATPRAPRSPAAPRAPRSDGRVAVVRIGDPPSVGADAGKDQRLMGMVGGMLGDALREMDLEG